ncbi:type II and III secretion system protein [Malonomonas rubra DSM 5091]|uniref:Type II and III secretion system protein n=1 Tax=Malonomonas rubra DSM 5091 TaxID=1122189 RepID=A0A1M6LHV2_MALRU|nr:hypothetical protein [Malonomonas rubra]SHJ70753.1 type II and III secretion system protein [Malonomonas rubra DSM 5091]
MKKILLLILLSTLPLCAFAEVKIIEVKHRAASSLESQVREILDNDEKVQAAGSHLILVADGESLQAAVKLIELLDVVQRNLLIRVRQSENRQVAGEESAGTVRYNTKAGVTTSAKISTHLGNSKQSSEQSLLLVEGGRGLIEVGRDIPYTQQWAAFSGENSGYAASTAYKKVATGFWIYPEKIVEDKVLVDVEPYIGNAEQSGTQPPQIDFAQLRTRLQVPLGEWYPLGNQLMHRDKVSRAIIRWRSSDGESDKRLEIRIDPAD